MTALSNAAARWFEKRGICPETAARYGIYTGRADGGNVTPDDHGDVIVFPFVDHARIVAEKYRGAHKRFWQKAGGKRTFWNADALDDPALASGAQALVITEGEVDALTAIDCGFPLTVSVPDGAPAAPAGKAATDLDAVDLAQEHAGKFAFVFANRDRLAKIKRFILAVDADEPGQRLGAEIVRRIGAGRCFHVAYPPEAVVPVAGFDPRPCKDLNEVRMHFGPEAVSAILNAAKPYPVKGLYRLSEYPDVPDPEKFTTGWPMLDQHLRIFRGEFMVVLGIPSHGKTTIVSNLLVNLAERFGLKAVLCSPEMPIVPIYRNSLRRMVNATSVSEQDAFIERAFRFIDASPDDVDEEITLKWILERATDALMRDGIDLLVIDPWNEIEHERAATETQTEYIGRALRVLKRWARKHAVAVILVVHPTKAVLFNGKHRMPTPYDCADSAHFYNKCDHMVIVHRPKKDENRTIVRVAKVRFDGTGERGDVTMAFNRANLRFEHTDSRASDENDDEAEVMF